MERESKILRTHVQEWRERLRSSLHPFLFAGVYQATAFLAESLHLETTTRAELLLAAPKVLQGCFAALTDFFIWKLAEKAYGRNSQASHAAVGLAVLAKSLQELTANYSYS